MKITRSFPSLLALAAGLVLASGAVRAAPITWANDQLNVQVLDPNPQTVYFNGYYNFTDDSPLTIQPYQLNRNLELIISPTGTVTFENVSSTSGNLFAPHSSIVKISDLTASPIQNVQIDPASNFTLNGPPLFGNNFLQFDAAQFPNYYIPPSGRLVLDVTFTPGLGSGSPSSVPEPASLALFGTGLLGLGLIRWRRKTA